MTKVGIHAKPKTRRYPTLCEICYFPSALSQGQTSCTVTKNSQWCSTVSYFQSTDKRCQMHVWDKWLGTGFGWNHSIYRTQWPDHRQDSFRANRWTNTNGIMRLKGLLSLSLFVCHQLPRCDRVRPCFQLKLTHRLDLFAYFPSVRVGNNTTGYRTSMSDTISCHHLPRALQLSSLAENVRNPSKTWRFAGTYCSFTRNPFTATSLTNLTVSGYFCRLDISKRFSAKLKCM